VRTSEWVVVAYFLYLLATAAMLRARAGAVLRLTACAVPTCTVVVILASADAFPVVPILRDWLPGAYVMIGYWATGLLYRGPDMALEARLEAWDARLFALLGPFAARLPSFARELVELAYLFCYPLVPTGIAVLYAIGERSRADSFWTVVLVSTFAAYAVLPWAGTRPPRALEAGGVVPRSYFFQRANLAVLARGSIQVNTFPSGHAASAWAVALFMTTVPGAPWLAFGLFAVAIGAGAIAGRYHYALDVVAGVGVAVAAFAVLA
jgi:membrane-associated phospholipid phosphatase